MPFHRYSSYFEPEELSKLAAAYEAAWQELLPESSSLTPDAIFLLKKKLAQIILASACTGKRDVDQLKQIAVRGMSGRISTPSSPSSAKPDCLDACTSSPLSPSRVTGGGSPPSSIAPRGSRALCAGLGGFGLNVSEHVNEVGKLAGVLGEKFFLSAL
jgi:hypothetical protein